MTTVLDLKRNAFIYAQDLDNKGGTEYWCISDSGTKFDRLKISDQRTSLISQNLDEMNIYGRYLSLGIKSFECKVRWSGTCTVTIRPNTLDANGRLSPVIVILSLLSADRHQATAALEAIPKILGRELGQKTLKDIVTFRRILKFPSLLLFFSIILLSRRKKND
jgi:hypothetical protein